MFIQKTSLGNQCANKNIYKCELIRGNNRQEKNHKNEKLFIRQIRSYLLARWRERQASRKVSFHEENQSQLFQKCHPGPDVTSIVMKHAINMKELLTNRKCIELQKRVPKLFPLSEKKIKDRKRRRKKKHKTTANKSCFKSKSCFMPAGRKNFLSVSLSGPRKEKYE